MCHQYIIFSPFTTVTTVSTVLVSGTVLVISTAIITSIIVWCVMRRRRPSSHATATTDHDKEQVTELATVIYDTPNVIKEHTITTQENVAYIMEGQYHSNTMRLINK